MNKKEEARVKHTQRGYNVDFKLSVVDQVEKGDFTTYKQAQNITASKAEAQF